MPKEWYDLKAVQNSERLSPEEKELYARIVADRKPYFMKYVYSKLNTDYNAFTKIASNNCMMSFGVSPDELCRRYDAHELTAEDEIHFVEEYRQMMPMGDGDCVMNKVCHCFEDAFDVIASKRRKPQPFDYSILKSGAKYTKAQYYNIKSVYDEYCEEVHKFARNAQHYRYDDAEATRAYESYQIAYDRECSKVCSNAAVLCDIFLDLCYKTEKSKAYVWKTCGAQIIKNLLVKNGGLVHYPMAIENCDDYTEDEVFEFKGNKYVIRTGVVDISAYTCDDEEEAIENVEITSEEEAQYNTYGEDCE